MGKSCQYFCNTLVDRIIPGVGKEALPAVQQQVGFEDKMLTQGEPYHFWAIEAPQSVRTAFPLDKIGLNIVYTDDLSPFRTIKVRNPNSLQKVKKSYTFVNSGIIKTSLNSYL